MSSTMNEQRDNRGRFTIGNSGGPGNPHAGQTQKLKSIMLNRLTEVEMEAITDALIEKAKAGNIQAARILFSYCLGKPSDFHNIADRYHHPDTPSVDLEALADTVANELREELRPKTPKERHEERKRARKRLKRQQRARPAPSPNGKKSNPNSQDRQIKDASCQNNVM